jgi:3-oxoacyl-[acyl-carrier protein] reductase
MPTILITGAANGIGFALTKHFLKADYQVIATDINTSSLDEIATKNLVVHQLDVTEPSQWQSVFESINRLDVIINNAGIIIPGFVAEINLQEASKQIDINAKGCINGSVFAAKMMEKQGFGHIINIASLAGVAPIQGLPIYAASKAAVRSFTLSIAFELKQKGIFASVVCPDLVDTDMLTSQLAYESAALTFSGDKILQTDDIVDAIVIRAIKNKEVEILVPKSRGILAKLGNLFPTFGNILTERLSKKGLQTIHKIKTARNL